MNFLKVLFKRHRPPKVAIDLFKYLGPGLLVTVGFIDPGNWAVNIEAGSEFGYELLWVISLSCIMLIVIQHNAAHLGIATGLCLSEATNKYLPRKLSRPILSSAILASISTSLAEILGGAIALEMLFNIPINIGAIIIGIVSIFMLFSNSYRQTEKWIVAFVSIIGFSFLYELWLVDIDWGKVAAGWTTPSIPEGSILIIMSVLGAVVMPHNLFLHSEVIQSRQWNTKDESVLRRQLKYEYFDTIFSMVVGWAINSAMILLAASTFFATDTVVTELQQAKQLLVPLLGNNAGVIFAFALLLAGISSTVTSAIAGASIFAGMFGEPFSVKDIHSKIGALISIVTAVFLIFLVKNPFQGLILSQTFLSVQLPITIFTQVFLTSSKRVMGVYANKRGTMIVIVVMGVVVTALNLYLLFSFLTN